MSLITMILLFVSQYWWLDMEQLGMEKTTGLSRTVGARAGEIRDTLGSFIITLIMQCFQSLILILDWHETRTTCVELHHMLVTLLSEIETNN